MAATTTDCTTSIDIMSISIVYIHGFNSSPQSHKAQLFKQWLQDNHPAITLHTPALKPYPLDAVAQLESLADMNPANTGFIGSSLGGFYAVHLAEKYRMPAVLINPSVRPFDTLARYLGENENFHTQERYVLTQQHVDDLRSLYIEKPGNPDKLLLLTQTADETLDFREATAHFHNGPAIIEYGGDHSFQHAERHFPFMLHFLQKSFG
ncbi:MAG TPA: YqiA/YcfP family alpha/beta fold hydrolase [Pseudomonadales bacterium]|nr:YqiA/YcfP family alpha/beta fold hydrolase [Pseudomonadales bacterium]